MKDTSDAQGTGGVQAENLPPQPINAELIVAYVGAEIIWTISSAETILVCKQILHEVLSISNETSN